MSNLQNFAITTPLFYVNDLPHIGSAYPTMAADALGRHHRQRGENVLMITGTDEHGQKIQRTAQSRNLYPQQHCDEMASGFRSLWEKLNINCDRFIRTTSPKHKIIVNEFFMKVWNAGDIYLGKQQGWYCVNCEEFKEEKELLENRKCQFHPNTTCEWRNEENYFFRLSAYQKQLEELYNKNPTFLLPDMRRNEILNFISQGLKDFSISRVNLDWGFPLPTDPNHTLYVWFDALLGYITALLEPQDEPILKNAISRFWPIDVHLVGKDILRFHAIYWPAMLMSAGIPLPKKVFGHGFLTKNGQKMGKSLGNVIDPYLLTDQYGSDAVRYFFLKEIEFGKDSDFNEQRFINVINADLANDLGNLLNRTLKMVQKYFGLNIPNIDVESIPEEHPLKKIGKELANRVFEFYDRLEFSKACEEIFILVQTGNQFIDQQAPWKKYKEGNLKEVSEILYSVLESLRLVAYLMYPIIPNITYKIYKQLGYKSNDIEEQLFSSWQGSAWGLLPIGQFLPEAEPIFQRIESEL